MYLVITYIDRKEVKRQIFPVNAVNIERTEKWINIYSLADNIVLGSFNMNDSEIQVLRKESYIITAIHYIPEKKDLDINTRP